MTSRFPVAAALLLLVSALAWADFTPSAWAYRKRLPVDPSKPIAAVHVDRQIFAKASHDLEDIRIVRGSEEVPHLITRLAGSHDAKLIDAEVLDSSAIGDSVQFVLAFSGATRHSRVTLATPETNFKKKVKLEASSDRKTWSLIRKEAYIFDFTFEAQHSSILTIDYPVSTRPYLRVTIEGWKDPAVLSGASVSLAEERAPVRQVVQEFSNPAGIADAKTQSMAYLLDFGENGVPKDLLRLEISGDEMFHRAIDIEVSDDNKGWVPHGRGVIFRMPDEQSLWLPMSDTRSRYVKVRIFHQDNKPVAVRNISAESILRRVIFPVTANGDYWIYYGNRKARTPAYDLPMILAKSSIESAATINPTPEEANPGYEAPLPPVKPFSDRHPEILYGALGVAVLAIGFMTVRFIQKASSSTSL